MSSDWSASSSSSFSLVRINTLFMIVLWTQWRCSSKNNFKSDLNHLNWDELLIFMIFSAAGSLNDLNLDDWLNRKSSNDEKHNLDNWKLFVQRRSVLETTLLSRSLSIFFSTSYVQSCLLISKSNNKSWHYNHFSLTPTHNQKFIIGDLKGKFLSF